jgi:hypothetical protein
MIAPASDATVFVDADNTLWDTDAVFASAQLELLAGVEELVGIGSVATDPLAFIREIDQQLAERHHRDCGIRRASSRVQQASPRGLCRCLGGQNLLARRGQTSDG